MTTAPTTIQERIDQPIGGGAGGASSPSAGDIVAMLRRRAVLITILFIFFTAIAFGGFAVWYLYFPGFRSECLIECISNIPETELTLEQERLRQDEHERFVRTQAYLLKSPTILAEALKITAVRETSWYRSIQPNQHLLKLTKELVATPLRGTNFLRVVMACRDRNDPRVIVNEVVRQWYEEVKQRSADAFATGSLDAARTELDDLDRSIGADRDRLRSIAQRLPPGAVQNPADNITAQQVRQFGEQVALLELEMSQLEQFRAIYNDPEGVAVTAEDRAMVERDPQVAELARTVSLLEQQRAADERVYGAGHSVFRQLDAQIEAANARLVQLRLEKLRERRSDLREATNTAYDNTRYAFFLARENLAKAEASLQDQDRSLFDYLNIEDKIDNDLVYRTELSTYVKSLSRVRSRRTAINVLIAQPAIDPLEQASPSLFLIPVAPFLALVFAIGIALTLELTDNSVRTSQDVVRHLNITVLGTIPDTDDEETPIKQAAMAVRDAPRSLIAEAFRSVRTNLQFAVPADRQRIIVVTSPSPEDGTTTVACNMAVAAAQSGRRVLLVDGNLRRPGLHRIFDGVPADGLSTILAGNGSLDALVVSSSIPNLDVLGSGPIPPNPVELIGNSLCRSFMDEATSRYDQIIIDTPPAALASDGPLLATLADGVVLVIRANRSSRGIARRTCNILAEVNAHLIGVVLNAARVRRGGYYREQLRNYYDYQGDA